MSRLTTKQRRAARFRQAVARNAGRVGDNAVPFLPAVAVYQHRLPWSWLRAQGWRPHAAVDGFVRGDPVWFIPYTVTLRCSLPGWNFRILAVE